MRWFLLMALVIAALGSHAAAQPRRPDIALTIESPRKVFYRGEEAKITVLCKNSGAQPLKGLSLRANLENLVSISKPLPDVAPGETLPVPLKIPTAAVRAGQNYPLTITLGDQGRTLATLDQSIFVAPRPNPDRLEVWLWVNGGPVEPFYEQHGFTSAGGPVYPYSPAPGQSEAQIVESYVRSTLEQTMQRGIDASIFPHNGLWERDFSLNPPPEGEDIRYKGAARNGQRYYNPFNPLVAQRQNHANELMMRAAGDYPSLKYAFVGMEWVDDLSQANTNKEGLALMKKELGFTPDQIGQVHSIALGVIPDNDRAYAYHKYVYKMGNGTALVCQRVADVVHRFRPDVKVLADPFRTTALYDLYPGLDMIETWTYTNPDPKLMLYVDTLIAACKPANQIPLQVITMLNYPGSIAPEEKGWMLMGPDRIRETSWIVLSRAAPIIGYYYGSQCDPVAFAQDTFRVPPESSGTIQQLSEKVFQPYGPMIRRLHRSPRRIALLNSASSRVHSRSPGLLGYPNEQILHFQSVMEMAHLNTDIVFDETIERYGLEGYDVLVMPKCDTLTSTVYGKIRDFQKRGGILIADQYLEANFPGVIRFNFDFTYRNKVNADAIAKNRMYAGAGSDDHIKPGTTAMQTVAGVTAEDDQLIMASYAQELKKTLAGKVDPSVWCDRPDVLFNLTESNGVKYLFVINDRREYGPRVGQYKAMLEKLVPQTVMVGVRADHAGSVVYDLLAQKRLEVKTVAAGGGRPASLSFPVELRELGGTIIALCPEPYHSLSVNIPAEAKLGQKCPLRIGIADAQGKPVQGLQPLYVEVRDSEGRPTEHSSYHCAENGTIECDFIPALNAPAGQWTLRVSDLTSGLTTSAKLTMIRP